MITLPPIQPYANPINARCSGCGSRGRFGLLWPDHLGPWCEGCGGWGETYRVRDRKEPRRGA